MSTLYDILGISDNATSEEIKKAYRKLSIKFHPDKNEGDAYFSQMFRQINEAYSVLLSPEDRRNYDFQLREQSNSKSNAERLKKLEEELAYKNSLLMRKNAETSSQQNSYPSKKYIIEKNDNNFPIKIRHIKYFLWVAILGLVIAISTNNKGSEKPTLFKSNITTKKHKKPKKKKIKSQSTKNLKYKENLNTDSIPSDNSTLISPGKMEHIIPTDTTKVY